MSQSYAADHSLGQLGQLEQLDKQTGHLANIAIFWDIENVTPRRGSFFADGLIEFAEGLGKVVLQNAYADWSKNPFQRLGLDLAQHHFYMVHLPYRRQRSKTEQRGKNSADIQLVSDALDSLRVYGHIDTYILVTGDSDFRPLLRPLRRMGKTIHIICDIRTASQDLLMIADSFQDYRELMPSRDEEARKDAPTEEAPPEPQAETKPPKGRRGRSKAAPAAEHSAENRAAEQRDYWFSQLCEAVQALEKEEKTLNLSTLRIQMRMLNPDFDQRSLGFSRWSQFIAAAVENNYLSVGSSSEEDPDSEQVIRVIAQPETATGVTITLQKAMQELLSILQSSQGAAKDADADAEGYLLYAVLNSRLREREIDVRQLGFNQFKKFMASAEARGLIETKLENMNYLARLSPSIELPNKTEGGVAKVGRRKAAGGKSASSRK